MPLSEQQVDEQYCNGANVVPLGATTRKMAAVG